MKIFDTRRLIPIVAATLLGAALVLAVMRNRRGAPLGPAGFQVKPHAAALDRTVTQLRFESTPFALAVKALAHQTNMNIVVKWRALASAGVAPDSRVSLELRDVPMHTALTMLLEAVTQKPGLLDYCTNDDVIIISTADDAGLCPVTRVYDIRDFVRAELQWRRQNAPATRPVYFGNEAIGWRDEGANVTEAEATQDFVDLIESLVAPETWMDNGGTAPIRSVAGVLLITQTRPLHWRIEQLLGGLRQALGTHR